MNIAHKRMTVDEFLLWAEAQPSGRFELIAGEIVKMASERARHARVKMLVAAALQAATAKHEVFPDGMTVRIDEHTAYEPDAALVPRGVMKGDDIELFEPLLVVEVLSPGTGHTDRSEKLVGYFQVPSIQHYLVVDPARRVVTRHRRTAVSKFETVILDGDAGLAINPPGFTVPIAAFWPAEEDFAE